MMAWQVAAKTTRDSLFLSTFPASALPAMVGAASVCSILLAVLSARLLRRFGPFRLIPSGYLLSAALHLVEWLLLPRFTRAISVLVYLHVLSLGAVLLSGFWALANEQFDPRQARKRFGRIAGYGTLGGLAGGILAERVVALFSNAALLPLLMALQCACGAVLLGTTSPKAPRKPGKVPRFREVVSHAPYLTSLAALIVLVSVTATTLDFLFKAQAVAQIGRGAALSRFFALFYMSTSAASFLAQAGASRFWLDRFGLGRTVATLPVGVAGAGLLALLAPGAVLLTLARGLELVLRGSLFRSGYELFYTPMPRDEKRAAKSVIDIGADRLGDGLGAGAVQLLLLLPAAIATHGILALTVMLAGAGAWLSFRLDRAYGVVLRKNLAETAPDLEHIEVEDLTTRSVIQSAGLSIHASASTPVGPEPPSAATDLPVQQLAALRSTKAGRVKETLREIGLLDPLLVPQVIQLLAREDVWRAAHDLLARSSFRIAGQLVDCLLDQHQDLALRKRIPRLLVTCGNRQAWNGLFQGLEDPSFEIRFRCGRSLDSLLHRRPDFRPEPVDVYRIIASELAARDAGQARQGPKVSEEDRELRMVDRVLQARASPGLAYIFYLLGLVLPREAVQTAFRALHTDDPRLQALALEYIVSALPRELREPLCARIEVPRTARVAESPQQPLARLLDESTSIVTQLENLGTQPPGSAPGRKT